MSDPARQFAVFNWAASPAGSRVAVDRSGRPWIIAERDARAVPGSLRDSCLILDGMSVCRRLWDYPDNWRELPIDALLALPPVS